MTYTAFSITKSKKEKDCWIINSRHERNDSMGHWEGGGTYGYLWKVYGGFVLMQHTTKPIAVFTSLEHFKDWVKKTYHIEPEML